MLNKEEKSSKDDGKDGKTTVSENSANISAQDKLSKDSSMPTKLSDDPFKIKDLSGPSDSAKDFSSVNLSQSGEKRPRDSTEDDDETLKKKSKKEEIFGSSTSSNLMSTKPIRGTRGSFSEKSIPGIKKVGKRGSPASSVTNSPSKPSSRDHSDEEDAEAKQKAASAASNATSLASSMAGSSATSITTSNSSVPKVPPLKIVFGNSGTSSVLDDKNFIDVELWYAIRFLWSKHLFIYQRRKV